MNNTKETSKLTGTYLWEVARSLGTKWQVQGHNDWYAEVFTDRYRIELSIGYPHKRIGISGRYPRDYEPARWQRTEAGDPVDSITVAVDRDPKAVAREITNRLLPGYEKLLVISLAKQKQGEEYKAKTEETIEEIVTAGYAEHPRNRGDVSSMYLKDSHSYQVTASGDSVRFEHFSCPKDVALRVMAMLRKKPGEE